jgi:RNA polymerase sigma-70 factor (ECF subfamily)
VPQERDDRNLGDRFFNEWMNASLAASMETPDRPRCTRGRRGQNRAQPNPNEWNVTKPEQQPGPDGATTFACVARAWQVHEGELRGYLRRRLADADAAADLLQDVFVKAMRQGQGFCAIDNPRAWLFQVARNALIDRRRMERPTEPLPDDLAETAVLAAEAWAPVDALADCLTRVLGEMPVADATIVRACDLQGQTLRTFAAENALSLPAAKSRLLRARQRLRDRMTAACQVRFEDDGNVGGHVPRPAVG